MTGEYPIATLRYIDSELPVRVELSAFTPFAPLDARVLLPAAGRIDLPPAKSNGGRSSASPWPQ